MLVLDILLLQFLKLRLAKFKYLIQWGQLEVPRFFFLNRNVFHKLEETLENV